MSIHRIRATLLGFLMLLALGSFAASAAYGEAGPFWHHRANSKEGEGFKVEESAQEAVSGKGGEQILGGTIGKEPIEISSKELTISGHIYNNSLQGQAKLELTYHEPKLVKPVIKGCEVKVGQNNIVNVQFHLVWTWNGEASQLLINPQFPTQLPDGIIIAVGLQPGAKELPKAEFTKINLSSGCGVLSPGGKVEGSVAISAAKPELKEWLKATEFKITKGVGTQHWWNGTAFVGGTTGLTFAGNTAEYKGNTTLENASQENAIFEK